MSRTSRTTRGTPTRRWAVITGAGDRAFSAGNDLVAMSQLMAGGGNAMAGDDPFLRHEFLSALHETGCASP